jgi:ferrochelatase
MTAQKTGVLVVNLGTPDAPETGPVRRYLAEFLRDPRVLDIHPIGRWMLLNLIILPTRPAKSAEAYRKVWTPEGSPLLVQGRALTAALAAALPDCTVELAMRYGRPSIEAGLDTLRAAGCDRLVIFPLYPQYAASSTGSTLEAIYRLAAARWNTPSLAVVPPYYDDPGFIDAFAAIGGPVLDAQKPDHVLMSFHGLPERHMRKSDETGDHCLRAADCCAEITFANRNCYRAQCFATARLLASALGLGADDYTICFQSRLGRTPWIRPYTDQVIEDLAQKGIRSLAVLCPAFTADCLETLEEIGMRALDDFKARGGEALTLVPSLNAHPAWVEAATALIRRTAGGWIDEAGAAG